MIVVTKQLIQIVKFISFVFHFLSVKMEKFQTTLIVLSFCIVFLLGFVSANFLGVLSEYSNFSTEVPLLNNFLGLSQNSSAPSDFVSENQIEIYDDRVVIYVDYASLSRYAPTGSMIPILDENSNGIRVPVNSAEEINIGDIISFYDGNDLIVHRVIEKGTDEKGVYFVTKGDNNPVDDGKIRIEDIKHKTVGVIW